MTLDEFHGALVLLRLNIVLVSMDVLDLAAPTDKFTFLLILRIRLLIITRGQRSFSSCCSFHCDLFDSLHIIFLLLHLHDLIGVVVALLVVN